MYSNEVEINLQRFIDEGLGERVKQALEQVGQLCEEEAKAMCPVDTGQLQNSITHDVVETTVILSSDCEYAPYVELGTYKMAAQPFMQPALEKNKSRIEKCFEGIL